MDAENRSIGVDVAKGDDPTVATINDGGVPHSFVLPPGVPLAVYLFAMQMHKLMSEAVDTWNDENALSPAGAPLPWGLLTPMGQRIRIEQARLFLEKYEVYEHRGDRKYLCGCPARMYRDYFNYCETHLAPLETPAVVMAMVRGAANEGQIRAD